MTTNDTTLNDIEAATKEFSLAHGKLSQAMKSINEELEKVKRKHMPALKHLVAKASAAEATLTELIESAPQLFEKPRTYIFHGVKVGLTKQKGKIEIEDPDRTVALIKKHFKNEAELLINTKETPCKDAIGGLMADDLKKIGVTITSDTDAVVIKPTDGDIEKAVQALLKNATEEALEQEAA
jgi:hypothetical protein